MPRDANPLRIDAARKKLARAGIRSPRDLREASADVRRALGSSLSYVEHLVAERDTELLRLVFWDPRRLPIDWHVAEFGTMNPRLGLVLDVDNDTQDVVLEIMRLLVRRATAKERVGAT
ncbi:MAG: hypothetical protein U0821_18535 [Chloroflexota bacterium]